MRKRSVLAILTAVALACAGWLIARRMHAPAHTSHVAPIAPTVDATYAATVQPILNRRCVVCHACFDSPCELNLQSFDGLERGASQTRVYEASRFESIHTSRMFQDAQSTAEWRERFGFFPVLSRVAPANVALDDSILWRLVEQRRAAPGPAAVDIDGAWVCPRERGALEAELRAAPTKGMPYGFPPLADVEAGALEAWLRRGGGGPPAPAESDAARGEIPRWESFLNARDARTRIVARYLYEHLFLAHIAFDRAPGEWFRLVRSRTAAPAPVDEIATVRPYDDPGTGQVFYRLRPLREAIVEKTHAPYVLSDAKLTRLRQIFLDAAWPEREPAFPSYEPGVAANPFVAFHAIPPRARYQFLLDDAYYHVETFIHGPVCKGQVALNVIDEHFLIFFLAPGSDPAVNSPRFLDQVAHDLLVPAQGGDGLDAVYARFKLHELSYLRSRGEFLKAAAAPGHTTADIWDGDGTNRGAVLTVYRHFDSAFVVHGPVGGVPKTAWVLDYPIFERLYYDLVAGFDVFGNVIHQVSTRRYMNLLRIEAESSFLGFLPTAQRKPVRDAWYRPRGVSDVVDVLDPLYAEPETRIAYTDPTHAKEELVRRLVTTTIPRGAVGEREPVQWEDVAISGDDLASRFERAARRFVRKPGPLVAAFPDAALVRVRGGSGGDTAGTAHDAIYTLVRNKEHLNIDFMFLEDEERAPVEDTLHVVRGVAVSRPNLFLDVDDPQAFAADLLALGSADMTWARFLDRYGVRRSDGRFWQSSDFFNARFAEVDPIGAGILDLSRYVNDRAP